MNQEKIKQVTTKNPKRVAASKKSYEERMEKMMLKMKKEILENAGINDSNDTKSNSDVSSNDGNDTKSDNDVSSNDSNDISGSSTNTTKSNNDVYFYVIGGLSILVLGFLVHYNFNKIKPQKKCIEVNTKKVDVVYRSML